MIGRWFVGFVVFVGYLCLGAFVFYRIERKEEEKRHFQETLEQLELKGESAEFCPYFSIIMTCISLPPGRFDAYRTVAARAKIYGTRGGLDAGSAASAVRGPGEVFAGDVRVRGGALLRKTPCSRSENREPPSTPHLSFRLIRFNPTGGGV